jgi:septal ring factor EnvC (AmiA/AmiB activator)
MIVCGKYSKKYGAGLRLTVVLVAFLLVVSPLAAWSSWLGGSAAESSQMLQLEKELERKTEQIESIRNLIPQLEAQLEEQKMNSDSSKKIIGEQEILIANLKEQLKNSEESRIKVAEELKMLKTLYGLSEESYQTMKSEYEALKVDYNEKADESEEYYQNLVQTEAKTDTGLHGVIGASALYDVPAGDIGTEISIGVGFGDVTFIVGAEYTFSKSVFSLTSLDPRQLKYRAGLQVRF